MIDRILDTVSSDIFRTISHCATHLLRSTKVYFPISMYSHALLICSIKHPRNEPVVLLCLFDKTQNKFMCNLLQLFSSCKICMLQILLPRGNSNRANMNRIAGTESVLRFQTIIWGYQYCMTYNVFLVCKQVIGVISSKTCFILPHSIFYVQMVQSVYLIQIYGKACTIVSI